MNASLCGLWDISWIHSAEDFTGKKRIAFLSSPIYRFLQNSLFSIEIGFKTLGLDEYLSFKLLTGGEVRESFVFSLGVFSQKTLENGSVQVTILQNCDESFQKISILRLGPQLNQRSCDHFFLDNEGNLRVSIMATDSKGELHNVKRVFTRSPSSISTSVQLRKYGKTLGWDTLEFWPAKILENWDIKLMRAARTKIPSLEMEIIWSIDQSVEDIKRLNFATNDDVWRIDYWIQVSLGGRTWEVSIAQDSLIAAHDLVRFQNTIPATIDSIFKKLHPQTVWKNYVDLHRHMVQVEGLFRLYGEHWTELAQNAIDCLCCLLDIPLHSDNDLLKNVAIPTESIDNPAPVVMTSAPSMNRLRSFSSFRIDVTKESLSSYPSNGNLKASSIHNLKQSRMIPLIEDSTVEEKVANLSITVPSDDHGDDTVITAKGSADVIAHLQAPPRPLSQQGAELSPAEISVSSTPPMSTTNKLTRASSPSIYSEPRPTNNTGRRALQDIVHRSSAHIQGGRGMRASLLQRHDSPTNILFGRRRLSLNSESHLNDDAGSDSNSVSASSMEGGLETTSAGLSVERGDSFSSHLEAGEYSATDLIEKTKGKKQLDIQYQDIYQEGGIVLKYMPVDMVNAPKIKGSIARGLLAAKLGEGILVIKHGRQGKPKRKILKCDADVSSLLWYPEHGSDDTLSEGKGIQVADIQDLRLGTDVDPTTIDGHITLPNNQNPLAPAALGRNLLKKTTNVFSSLFTKAETQNNAPDAMYGSAVLRRNCTAEELALSFSLVLQDRTLDIQCLNKDDFVFLTVNLRELIKPQLTPILRTASNGDVDAYEENPLKKILKKTKIAELLPDDVPATSEVTRQTQETNDDRVLSHFLNHEECRDEEDVHAFDAEDIEVRTNHLDIDDTVNSSSLLDEDAQFIESLRMSSTEALQIGLILTDQERKYGLNMYQAIQQRDISSIEKYVQRGFTVEEAILRLFEKKHVPPHLHTHLGPKRVNSMGDVLDSDDEGTDDEEEAKSGSISTRVSLEKKKKSSFLRSAFHDIENIDQRRLMKQQLSKTVVGGSLQGLSSRLRSTDALQIGLLLSQQEANYNTNMYESLRLTDAPELRAIMTQGKTVDDAVMELFQQRFCVPVDNNIHFSETMAHSSADKFASEEQNNNSIPSSSMDQKMRDVDDENIHNPQEETVDPSESVAKSFLDEQRKSVMESTTVAVPTTRTGSSFFPHMQTVLPANHSVGGVPPPRSIPRMNSSEAVQMAMMLSEQESKYGVNMFDSLRAVDEPEIERLVNVGYTLEQAVYALFEQKYMVGEEASAFPQVDSADPGLTVQQPASPLMEAMQQPDNDTSQNEWEEYEVHQVSSSSSDIYGDLVPTQPIDQGLINPQLQQNQLNFQPQYGVQVPQQYMMPNYATQQNLPQMYPGGYPGYYPPHMPMYPNQYQQQNFYGSPNQVYPGYPAGYGYLPQMAAGAVPNGNMTFPQMNYGHHPQQMMHVHQQAAFQQQQQQQQLLFMQQQQQQQQQQQMLQHNSMNRQLSSNSSVVSTGSSGGTQSTKTPAKDQPKPTRKASIFGLGTGGKTDKSSCKESDVKAIMNMGFTRDQAVNALTRNGHNILRAIDSLTS